MPADRDSTKRPRTARDAAVTIVRRLRDAGHTAYLAGGCVRDALLGLVPKDYDVATDARPAQVRRLVRRSRYVGESFGVVLVFLDDHPIEVATFRTEWGYTDKRRPDHVEFTDAEHDAQRRDFTINGLFADPLERDPVTGGDRIIDYVGGRADLEAGLIRAIGDPSERFSEDYLRMLRAVRFAARLDFEIEARTAAAIRPLAKYLGQISRERIGMEVMLMLTGPRPAKAARLCQQLTLDGPVLNEDHRAVPLPVLEAVTGPPHADAERDEATHLAAWMLDRHAHPGSSPTLAGAANFVDRDGERTLGRWRAALNLSNQQRDALWATLRLTARAAAWDELPVARRKRLLAEARWPEALRLVRAVAPAAADRIEREAAPLAAEGVAPPPLITGDDLIALGLKPGPMFGRLLEQVYDVQLEGRVASRDEALAWVRERVSGV